LARQAMPETQTRWQDPVAFGFFHLQERVLKAARFLEEPGIYTLVR
jgi:hypothetical protein